MPDLEYIFHPRSIAIVGVSRDASSYATSSFLEPLMQLGYEGKTYPVNPKVSAILGVKAYPGILPFSIYVYTCPHEYHRGPDTGEEGLASSGIAFI